MLQRGMRKLVEKRTAAERIIRSARANIRAAVEQAVGECWPLVCEWVEIEYGDAQRATNVWVRVPGLSPIFGCLHLDIASAKWRQVCLSRSDWGRGMTAWAMADSPDRWNVRDVRGEESYCCDLDEALALAREVADGSNTKGGA